MPKFTRSLLILTLVGAGAYGSYKVAEHVVADDSAAADRLVNQVWLERMPQGERDIIGHLVLIRHQRGRIGAVGRSSRWRHALEAFKWGLERDRLSLYFPQEESKGQLKARTWKCKGEAPAPFELCLELSSGKRSIRFYSREDWVIDPNSTEDSLASVGEGAPELAGHFDGFTLEGTAAIDQAELEGYAELDVLPLAD